MKIVHLPNTHWYQQSLIRALRETGVAVDPRDWGWGTYLPDALPGVLEAKPDLVHLHWPEAWCRQAVHGLFPRLIRRIRLRTTGHTGEWERWLRETTGALDRIQAAGARIVWTLHNLQPHGAAGEELAAADQLYRAVAERADGAIHHSRWGEAQAQAAYAFRPGCRHAVIPFGVFPDEAPADLTPAAARRDLDLPPAGLVLLTVGTIGPRKNLELLVDAVAGLPNSDCRLLVVGGGSPSELNPLAARGGPRVRFLGRLDQAGLSRTVRAADFLLYAPDPEQLTSGGPHTSETFLKPQLTTDTPYAREVLGDTALYFEPTVAGLQEALRQARRLIESAPEEYQARIARLAARRQTHGWPDVARAIAALYESLRTDLRP